MASFEIVNPDPHVAFYIKSNPYAESEMWYGVYDAKNLLQLEKAHVVVPMAKKDETHQQLTAQYGDVEYKGETNPGPPNFIGMARFGEKDIVHINAELDKKYRFHEYIYEENKLIELEPNPLLKEDRQERLNDLQYFDDLKIFRFLHNRRHEEEVEIFQTLAPFEAKYHFLTLLNLDNKQEITIAQEFETRSRILEKISKFRNDM